MHESHRQARYTSDISAQGSSEERIAYPRRQAVGQMAVLFMEG